MCTPELLEQNEWKQRVITKRVLIFRARMFITRWFQLPPYSSRFAIHDILHLL